GPHDVPVAGERPDGLRSQDLCAIHLPNSDGSIVSPPQNVTLAVMVEIARTGDMPVVWNWRQNCRQLYLQAVHLPNTDRAVLGAPSDISLAVGIEISRSSEMPICPLMLQDCRARERRAVHQPHRGQPRRGVLPDDVGFQIAIEIAGCGDERAQWVETQYVH